MSYSIINKKLSKLKQISDLVKDDHCNLYYDDYYGYNEVEPINELSETISLNWGESYRDHANLRRMGRLCRQDSLLITIKYASFCEYGQDDLIYRANYETIEKECKSFNPPVFHCHGHGGQQGQAAAFSVRDLVTNQELWDMFIEWMRQLENYPILDEDSLYELEQEVLDQSWDDWAKYDFCKELSKLLEVEDIRDSYPEEKLKELFYETIRKTEAEIIYYCDTVEIYQFSKTLFKQDLTTWYRHQLDGCDENPNLPFREFPQGECLGCGEPLKAKETAKC